MCRCNGQIQPFSGLIHQRWARRFDQYITVLKAAAANSTYVTINFLADNSVDKEVARSISSDIYLIAISIVIFIVLAVCFLSRYVQKATRTFSKSIG